MSECGCNSSFLNGDADSLARVFVNFDLIAIIASAVSKESSLVYYPKQMSIKGLKRWDLVINGEFRAVTEL